MDTDILLGSLIALSLLRVPVAYALGLATLTSAWWIEPPCMQ